MKYTIEHFIPPLRLILGIIAEKLRVLNFECKLWLNHKYYLSQTFSGYRNKLQFLFAYLKNNLSYKIKGKVKRSFPLNMLKSKIL